MTHKSVVSHLLEYVFPPKCVSCRSLIGTENAYMCDTCMDAYRAAKEQVCPLCLNAFAECNCPNRYMENNALHTLVKLYRYCPRSVELPESQLIYRLKSARDMTVIQFVAKEMAVAITRHIGKDEEFVLVGVPRSKRAIRKYDADHIALLCKELSKILNIPYIPAVRRIGKGKAQKTKRRSERILSAHHEYAPRKDVSLAGKTVILVDDVVTTGATLVACNKVVRKQGARKIICAVAGATIQYHDLISAPYYYSERRKKYGI